jgi:DNA-3-methyladenine glycosylase II
MRLAVCLDSFRGLAGVILRQGPDGAVTGRVVGDGSPEEVGPQVARILSLDHDGSAWPEVGERDHVLGVLQDRFPGSRPVLFCSPYEAAAWGVVAGHRGQGRALPVRRELCRLAGAGFELEGVREHAFPTPDALLALESAPGIGPEQMRRLHAIAGAALEGRLDARRLRAMDPEDALAWLRSLPGIGPFYAGLVLVRAAGLRDTLSPEPRLLRAIAHFYARAEALAEVAPRWAPFRTWAAVLVRRAAYVDIAPPAEGSPADGARLTAADAVC